MERKHTEHITLAEQSFIRRESYAAMLKTENLTFYYPKEETPAIAGVNFLLPAGGFITLCGVSGCGKSTLLKTLKPCVTPHGRLSGEIFFEGEPLSALSPRKAAELIGYVSQNPEAQTVTDKVWHEAAFGLESIGLEGGEIRRRAAECAEYFGISAIFERDTASLSGGEKQLLALASAAALHPRLLLLDEPTSQLDPISAQNFIDAIRRLNRDFGIAVLAAEHRLEELLPISDRVIVMDNGKITADCEPRALAELLPAEHPIRGALPISARIYALSGASDEIPPLTVREGKNSPAVRRYLKENPPAEMERSAANGKPILTVKELWVSYGRNIPDALKSASLTLREGEIYALLGGNGSGKTTLLKAVTGMIKPLGGKIRLYSKKPAYLPQNPFAILGKDSALEELTSRNIPEADAVKILSIFGISGELLSRDPLDLSGGERQRLALAALISCNPDLLLLDEPTKGMDAAAKRDFSELLKKVRNGAAVLLVTHDTEFAELCADRCGLLFNGEISGESAPDVFFGENFFYTTPLRRLTRGIL